MSLHLAKPIACFLRPDIPSEAYFFKDKNYVRITTDGQNTAYGPAGITESWPPLRKAGFDTVTATMATTADPHDVYFFSGDKCAFIKVIPEGSRGYLMAGPRRITEFWPPLMKLGWESIDAACQVPTGEIYFFKGSKFVVVLVNQVGSNEGVVVDGPNDILETWKKAGFGSVDCVLPKKQDSRRAYVFSGSKFALVDLVSGEVKKGPRDVAEHWKALHDAEFY